MSGQSGSNEKSRRRVWIVLLSLCLSMRSVATAQSPSVGASKTSDSQTLSFDITNGPVAVTTTLRPAQPIIGDEIEFSIEVRAEDQVEVLMPEFGEALERYTILEFVPREQVASDGSTIYRQKYTLQPANSGEQSIPPILIEFIDGRPGQKPAPDDFDAYEILTDRIDFTVQSVLPSGAAAELKPPLGALELVEDNPASSSIWVIAIAGIIMVCGLALSARFLATRRQARKLSAYEIARQRLDQLVRDRESDSPSLTIEQFFVEISSLIRQYLEDRFEVRAPDLTTDEFLQVAASESELSPQHQHLLAEFLKQADIVKFAGVQASDQDVRHSTELAARFLQETRLEAPHGTSFGESAQADQQASAEKGDLSGV